MPDILDVDIQIKGVTNLLLELDSHKATGPDSIPANLLKQTAVQIALLTYVLLYLKLQLSMVNYHTAM